MKTLKHIAVIALAVGVLAGLPSVASALTFGDANDLGSILFGIPSGDASRTQYVNDLIQLAPGTTGFQADGQTFNRSLANPAPGFGNYPAAVFASNGTGTSVDLGTGGFEYLFAKYDGPNAGAEVWFVGGLTGVQTIPANGLPPNNGYGLSGWTLFGPGGTPPPIPDSGSTVALLGVALSGLGALRRFVKG